MHNIIEHVQPVVPYVMEHNACIQGGWGLIQINYNVEVNSMKIHFVNVWYIGTSLKVNGLAPVARIYCWEAVKPRILNNGMVK